MRKQKKTKAHRLRRRQQIFLEDFTITVSPKEAKHLELKQRKRDKAEKKSAKHNHRLLSKLGLHSLSPTTDHYVSHSPQQSSANVLLKIGIQRNPCQQEEWEHIEALKLPPNNVEGFSLSRYIHDLFNNLISFSSDVTNIEQVE